MLSNDPLAAYRRERSQRNNVDFGQGSKAGKPGQAPEPLTEHQALRLAIDALNQIPNRSLNGEHRNTYALIPVLEQAYEGGKTTEKLTDAAPDLLEALQNLWGVCDANNYEVPMGYRNQIFAAIAKATPEPAPEQKTREEIEPEM